MLIRIARNRLSRILWPMMSQAIQNRQAAGPTAAIEFQMLPVQLSPVRASNSCRTDSAAIIIILIIIIVIIIITIINNSNNNKNNNDENAFSS